VRDVSGGGGRWGETPRTFAGSIRLPMEVWWKCAAGKARLFRYLRAKDVPHEEFALLPVRQSHLHPLHHLQATFALMGMNSMSGCFIFSGTFVTLLSLASCSNHPSVGETIYLSIGREEDMHNWLRATFSGAPKRAPWDDPRMYNVKYVFCKCEGRVEPSCRSLICSSCG